MATIVTIPVRSYSTTFTSALLNVTTKRLTVLHNLGKREVGKTVYDENGQEVFMGAILLDESDPDSIKQFDLDFSNDFTWSGNRKVTVFS